jgi:hypothetical protein
MDPFTVDGWREKYEAENTPDNELIQAATKFPTRDHGAAAQQVLTARRRAEEEKRYRETLALGLEELAAARYSNRLAWLAIGIAVTALVLAVYAAVKS